MATASTQTVEAPTQPGPRRRGILSRINFRQFGILAALVIIIVLFQVLTGGRLLMPGNVNNLIQQNAYVLILAIGMVMVIIAGTSTCRSARWSPWSERSRRSR